MRRGRVRAYNVDFSSGSNSERSFYDSVGVCHRINASDADEKIVKAMDDIQFCAESLKEI
jgi:hypothetical protein